jgi:PAS domain S-box-containing protein
METNYISIYDNTANAKLVYVSESVVDVLGFTPQELIGMGGYELTHPKERAALAIVHTANVTNERMSSLSTYRSRHKNGHYVTCDIIVHYCYDVMICTNFGRVSGDSLKARMRTVSADEIYVISDDGTIQLAGAWNDSQQKMKNLLLNSQPWGKNDLIEHNQEPRFCLIINRYTEQSNIVFASKYSESMVGLSQVDCIGTSLYFYVHEGDAEAVMKQLSLAKSKDLITRFRFKWNNGRKLIPVETVVSCTNDGLVMVVRLSPNVTVGGKGGDAAEIPA